MSTRSNNAAGHGSAEPPASGSTSNGGGAAAVPNLGTSELHWNESDFEKHFKDHGIFTRLSNFHIFIMIIITSFDYVMSSKITWD